MHLIGIYDNDIISRIDVRRESYFAFSSKKRGDLGGQPAEIFFAGIKYVPFSFYIRIAHDIDASFIVALTRSGRTARMISRYRPSEHIVVLSDTSKHINKLALSFGCDPVHTENFKTVEEAMVVVRQVALKNKLAKKGEKVVLVWGFPFGRSKDTNLILVETI